MSDRVAAQADGVVDWTRVTAKGDGESDPDIDVLALRTILRTTRQGCAETRQGFRSALENDITMRH